jgi:hypothetical protein
LEGGGRGKLESVSALRVEDALLYCCVWIGIGLGLREASLRGSVRVYEVRSLGERIRIAGRRELLLILWDGEMESGR